MSYLRCARYYFGCWGYSSEESKGPVLMEMVFVGGWKSTLYNSQAQKKYRFFIFYVTGFFFLVPYYLLIRQNMNLIINSNLVFQFKSLR